MVKYRDSNLSQLLYESVETNKKLMPLSLLMDLRYLFSGSYEVSAFGRLIVEMGKMISWLLQLPIQ